MVQKVRGLYNKATEWVESTAKILTSEEKLNRLDAKALMEEGEKLGFACEELKTLRNAHRAARNWASRVKKCKIEEGTTITNAIQDLLDEYDSLLIEMPEELSKLQTAITNYCLCRRPYSGFMIGCDECDEWYHGCCVGISETKADRVDKYVCVRCCTARVLKNSAKDVAGVIRKWTCKKDFKKARQVEAQKHQRKVRKETKEIEKLEAQINSVIGTSANAAAANESSASAGKAKGTVDSGAEAPQARAQVQTAENSLPVAGDASNAQVTGNPSSAGEVGSVVVPTQATTEDGGKKASVEASAQPISPEEAESKIKKAKKSIEQCQGRLLRLRQKAEEHKAALKFEGSKASVLRNWCLRVRTMVLFPRSEEDAKNCRPSKEGSLSPNMKFLVDQAKLLGVDQIADVKAVTNAFRVMAWSLLATTTLAKKSTLKDFELLVTLASSIKFPDEKAIRTIRSIHSRGMTWQSKVLKALAPSPGNLKPFDLETLKELEDSADDIPVRLAEESLLSATIAEKGERHCLCGGPSDARFMLSCDKCENWYHGKCVNMKKEVVTEDTHWICPNCSGGDTSVDESLCCIVWDEVDDLKHSGLTAADTDVSPEAPDANKMWPPFGLSGSASALEILGEECSSIPDTSTHVSQISDGDPPGAVMGATAQVPSDPITRMSVDNAQALAAQPLALQPVIIESQQPLIAQAPGFSQVALSDEAKADPAASLQALAAQAAALQSQGKAKDSEVSGTEPDKTESHIKPSVANPSKQEQNKSTNNVVPEKKSEYSSFYCEESAPGAQEMTAMGVAPELQKGSKSKEEPRGCDATESAQVAPMKVEEEMRYSGESKVPEVRATAMEIEYETLETTKPKAPETQVAAREVQSEKLESAKSVFPETQDTAMEVEKSEIWVSAKAEEAAETNVSTMEDETEKTETSELPEYNELPKTQAETDKSSVDEFLSSEPKGTSPQDQSTALPQPVKPTIISHNSQSPETKSDALVLVDNASSGHGSPQDSFSDSTALQNRLEEPEVRPTPGNQLSQSSQLNGVAMEVVMAAALSVQQNGR